MSVDYTFRRPSRKRGGMVEIRTAAPEQIMGALYYELNVAEEVLTGNAMQQWLKGAAKRTEKDFGLWLDERAKSNPAELQHVYDFYGPDGKAGIGMPSFRLFKLKTIPTDNSFKMTYQFLPSRYPAPIHPRLLVPGPSGKVVTRSSIFRQKAKVIESGLPVIIRPKGDNWLAVPIRGNRFRGRQNRRDMVDGYGLAFSRGPIIVNEPGGPLSTGGFGRNFRVYFRSGIATKRLKYSGYMDRVSQVAKIAGENLPPNVRRVSFSGGIDQAASRRWAKMATEQAAKIFDE